MTVTWSLTRNQQLCSAQATAVQIPLALLLIKEITLT